MGGWVGGWSEKTKVIPNSTQLKLKLKLELSLAKKKKQTKSSFVASGDHLTASYTEMFHADLSYPSIY